MGRATKEVLYLKYQFDDKEKLAMASTLASNHNALDDIEAEEAVFKSQIKERKSSLAQSVQTLSRNISMGFELRNISCILQYDSPNVGEVIYIREDTGEIAKTRSMTEVERQQELPLEPVAVSPEKSAENVADFFEKKEYDYTELADIGEAKEEEPEDVMEDPDVFTDPDPAMAQEAVKAEHDDEFNQAPRRRGRPKGSKNVQKEPVAAEAF